MKPCVNYVIYEAFATPINTCSFVGSEMKSPRVKDYRHTAISSLVQLQRPCSCIVSIGEIISYLIKAKEALTFNKASNLLCRNKLFNRD